MANQPEVTLYDSGVYQIEATDPVDGGVGAVTNAPLLSLSNRTNYLKKHIDDIENGTFLPDKLAPKESPTLTGTPKTPTQTVGDSTTAIASDEFVQRAIHGAVNVNVAGGANVTLAQSQFGYPTLILSGAITANIAVIFPSKTGLWHIVNNTTGAFTVTLKTAAGGGVLATQGRATNVYCDATSMNLQQTDFISPAMTGAPSAPTLGRFAAGTGIVNADTMNARGNQANAVRSVALSVSTVNLAAADAGSLVLITGTGGGTLVLPPANSVPTGAQISVRGSNSSVSTNTLKGAGSDTIGGAVGAGANSGIIRANDCLTLTSDGVSKWEVASESTQSLVVQQMTLGQTWQNVVGSRVHGVNYVNTTGRPIKVAVSGNPATSGTGFIAIVDNIGVGASSVAQGNSATVYFDVPPGSTYRVQAASSISNSVWSELR